MSQSDQPMGRRAVLRTVGVGAVAAGAAVVGVPGLSSSAAADDGDPFLLGEFNEATNSTWITSDDQRETLRVENSGQSLGEAITALATSGSGVVARSFGRSGVVATSHADGYAGVYGSGATGTANGVVAESENGDGLVALASSSNKAAVRATSEGSASAVIGKSVSGYGVDGSSDLNHGVVGRAAVEGKAAIWGRATGNAVGGLFEGGAAAVRLVPRSVGGPPTSGSHQRGELVVDSNGVLYFCKTDGTPGVWKKVKFGKA
jgi:hypothetical protein